MYGNESICKMTCEQDYESTNPEKAKTKITCACGTLGCSWNQAAEFECQGPCRRQTALYTKLNYYFKGRLPIFKPIKICHLTQSSGPKSTVI